MNVVRLCSTLALLAAGSTEAPTSPPAAPMTAPAALPAIQGKGVHYAEATIGCPLQAKIGDRDANACLRIALYDDDSSVQLDRQAHRIVVHNSATYAKETLIADVLLPGWSELPDGRSPAAAHLLIRKKGSAFTGKFHAHAMSREKPKSVALEGYEVVATDGKAQTSLMTVDDARKAALDPGLAAKFAGEFVEVKDNLPADAALDVAARPAGDITVALGVGPAADQVLRAQLFVHGADFEVRLTALSSLIPKSVIQRELLLYGLDGLSNLAEVKNRGLKSGETLVFTVHDGKGSARFRDTSVDFPNAADSVRGFFEGNFIGALLAHQAHLDAPR